MSKKSTALSPLKRPSTRSLSSLKVQTTAVQQKAKDKYTFQSDDEDHQTKPVLVRKTITPSLNKRTRGRPPKTPKQEGTPIRASLSSSNLESDSSIEEGSAIKRKPSGKYSYEKPVTRRASRLVSQTNTPIGEKVATSKKRVRKTKMSTATDHDLEFDKSKQQSETENIVPPNAVRRRSVKKKTLSTDTNPRSDANEQDDQNAKLSSVDEKELMQFGSPQHPTQLTSNPQALQQHQSDDDFSDDSVEFVWKGSSKLSIEILKRRVPKDEPRDQLSSTQADPTAQRKRAIIPRLTNFDALSGQPSDPTVTAAIPPAAKRINQDIAESNLAKKSSSVITLNNVFQNDFVPSYNDAGTKMTMTTAATTTATTSTTASNMMEEKPRPRIYAVKSTTMKARPRQASQPEIKRPKWMNDQQGKSEEEEDSLPPAGEEPDDFDYVPKGQYIPKRPNYRGRGTYPGRRGTGMRGRPPGPRRQWHDDDDDDDYDQYEDTHSRYGPRKQTAYRSSRPMYDMTDDNGDYDSSRRMSLTQAYRRNNAVRPPLGSVSGQRRIAINNGNHPIYKDEDYYHQQPTQTRSSATTVAATSINVNNATGQTFVSKMNDQQLNDVSNQSQIFFVNVPQQEQKTQQQVLSVLTTDQQQQQQVLPVTVVQQVKLPMDAPKQKKILPKPSSNNQQLNSSIDNSSGNSSKPFAWSRPPGRIPISSDDQTNSKHAHSAQVNTDLDTMEAAHVLATAADVTMAADARRKAQQHDDDIHMIVEETPSTIVSEETIQCDNDTTKLLSQQQFGTITANIIDENGIEHTVYLSTEEAQQLLGSQGAIIVDSDGQPISIQQAPPPPQTFVSPFALDQAQLQALLAQAGIDPNTPLTIEQVDPSQVQQGQQQQLATLCTSPGGTQYTVLTQGSTQQQFILQTTTAEPIAAPMSTLQQPSPPPSTATRTIAAQPQLTAPKVETLSPPPKRRAFAVKSTTTASRPDAFEDINANDRPRRKIFATKSTVTAMNEDMSHDEEGIIGTRAYHRNVTRK